MNCLLIWSCIQRFPREVMCSTFQKVKIRFGDILKPARPCEKQRHKPPRGAKIREQRDSLRRSGETRSVANVRIFATRRGDAGTNANTPQKLAGCCKRCLAATNGAANRICKEHVVRRNSAFCGIRSACEVHAGRVSRQRQVKIRFGDILKPARYRAGLMELLTGFEPVTSSLPRKCSTS